MIRWCDNGHAPMRVQSGTRCPACVKARGRNHLRDSMREAQRATPAERGYGAAHRAARRALSMTLPTVCGGGLRYPYCDQVVTHADRWTAAHVVDGDPSMGWVVAHAACNERAKRRVVADATVARATGGGRSESGR